MRKSLAGLAILFLCAPLALAAQEKEFVPSPAAKAEFKKGQSTGGNWKIGAEHFRKAIALDPDYYEAHEYYILDYQDAASIADTPEGKAARQKAADELNALYQGWAKAHPKDPVYPWALGILHDYTDPDLAIRDYHQALELDPQYAPAYNMLGVMEESRGNLDLSREDLQKAHEAWPGNAGFWGDYAASVANIHSGQAEQIALQMAEKFPKEGAAILGYIATRDPDANRSQQIEEMLWKKFPPQPDSGGYYLLPLFNTYLKSDPSKALALARNMVRDYPKNDSWPPCVKYAQAVIRANTLIAKGRGAKAIAALAKIKLPRYGVDGDPLEITRARALAASGDTQKAYASLVDAFAKVPSDALRAALLAQGETLAKNQAQVEADVWARRSADAKPGIPFSVVSFTTGKRVSLADYKGKVFLLNFFYPLCGPCRGEFPFLQSALDKYKKQGFEILAVNTLPTQSDMVLPLLKGWGLGFLPFKGNDDILKAYKVRGEPSNFLYGADGRIYIDDKAPFPVDGPSAERTLDLQIEALLQQAQAMRRKP